MGKLYQSFTYCTVLVTKMYYTWRQAWSSLKMSPCLVVEYQANSEILFSSTSLKFPGPGYYSFPIIKQPKDKGRVTFFLDGKYKPQLVRQGNFSLKIWSNSGDLIPRGHLHHWSTTLRSGSLTRFAIICHLSLAKSVGKHAILVLPGLAKHWIKRGKKIPNSIIF